MPYRMRLDDVIFNMGCVVAVFDVSFACSGRLCVEFALSLPFFWSLKKRDFGRFAVLTKKIPRIFSTPSGAYRGLLWTKIKLALPGKALFHFFRLQRESVNKKVALS